MRPAALASLALVLASVAACNDLRQFRGAWHGARVGDPAALLAGIGADASATLAIDQIGEHGIAGRLAVDGLLPETAIASLPRAEADVLAGITYSGDPLRVYLAFAPVPDGGGEALTVISLYDDRRVEVRLVRGGGGPLYGIFALSEAAERPAAATSGP